MKNNEAMRYLNNERVAKQVKKENVYQAIQTTKYKSRLGLSGEMTYTYASEENIDHEGCTEYNVCISDLIQLTKKGVDLFTPSKKKKKNIELVVTILNCIDDLKDDDSQPYSSTSLDYNDNQTFKSYLADILSKTYDVNSILDGKISVRVGVFEISKIKGSDNVLNMIQLLNPFIRESSQNSCFNDLLNSYNELRFLYPKLGEIH